MCMIIVKPYGTKIPDSHIWQSANNNPDGFGFYAYSDNEEKVFRSNDFVIFDKVLESYNRRDTFMVVHFRLSTQGTNGEKNIHPFMLKDGWYLAHNGIFTHTPWNKFYSDTYYISEAVKKFSRLDEEMEAITGLMENMDNSRIVFVKKDRYFIVNEHSGVWKEKCWYSTNELFRPNTIAYGYGHDYYYGRYNEFDEWDRDQQLRILDESDDDVPELPEEMVEFEDAKIIFQNLYGDEFPEWGAQEIFTSMGYNGMLKDRWRKLSIAERRAILDEIGFILEY